VRDTIDFGIDLGTTNSAIAVMQDGDVLIVKNNDGWDFTPSAVWMPKPGVVHVGRRARERNEKDAADTHAEFKLEMGLDGARRTFDKADVSLTPQQLSAEVLKSLRGDAAHQFGEPPQAAVITVPAAFRLHQNNATSEAAALAGFGACPLVQEPTAAAFAYGFQNESSEAYWMVFDFGGGTFDSAVVSTHDGELRVLDHAGDPHLGGKLIDWAVVERVLAPAAARELGLTDFTRNNPLWQRNFAMLKWAAEEAKISLSRTVKSELLVDLDVGDGRTESFEYSLQRDELDRVAEPYYLRAINLCRDALSSANLNPGDIDRLLLVGGATLAPGLRDRLADSGSGLGIELDHSQDPTTVVARGAAVFASTVPLERPKVRPAAGEFTADLRYPRTTSLLTVPVAGKFESSVDQDWPQFHVVLDNPDGKPPFRSPQVALDKEGTFVTEVQLNDQTASTFAVRLLDSTGRMEKVTPASITITHWLNEPGGTVLTNSLGLSEADKTFARILKKGTRLPATARGVFHTTVALHRTDTDAAIRIPIVEGEEDRGDRNLQVGLIEIRPKDVRVDLPRGSDVEVTIEVDESRRVTVIADVPLVDEQFEAEIDLSNVRPRSVEELERELADVMERLNQLRDSAEKSGSVQAQARLAQIDEERRLSQARNEVRAAANDDGSAAAADQHLRAVQSELDKVEKDVQLPGKLTSLTNLIVHCRELVSRLGDADDRAELAEIERRTEQVRANPDMATVQELYRRADDLETVLMKKDGTLEISVFYFYRQNQHKLISPVKGRALIAEGEEMIAEQDVRGLVGVNQRLRRLWPVDLPDPSEGGVTSTTHGRR
jgi:molecular chaperone DnaK